MKLFTTILIFLLLSLSSKSQTETQLKIEAKPDVEASFAGSEDMWNNFIAKNLKANIGKINGAPKGKYVVSIKFVVTEGGLIKNMEKITNFGYGMEEEVMRILPLRYWSPAKKNGDYVASYQKVQITFEVQ